MRRIIIAAELGGEQGMFMLLFDERTGRLSFDPSFGSSMGKVGYVDLEAQRWQHDQAGRPGLTQPCSLTARTRLPNVCNAWEANALVGIRCRHLKDPHTSYNRGKLPHENVFVGA